MATLTSRALAYRQSPHFTRLWKFASVSVISTSITQVVLVLTYHVWSLGSAMECNVIATTVATVPAYYLNRTWTFGKRGKSNPWREVMPFWVIAFVGLVLSTIAVGIAAHNADHLSHSKDMRTLIIMAANFVTYGLIWIGRYSIFNKYLFGARTHAAADSGEQPFEVAQAPSASAGAPSPSTTAGASAPASAGAGATAGASAAGASAGAGGFSAGASAGFAREHFVAETEGPF